MENPKNDDEGRSRSGSRFGVSSRAELRSWYLGVCVCHFSDPELESGSRSLRKGEQQASANRDYSVQKCPQTASQIDNI